MKAEQQTQIANMVARELNRENALQETQNAQAAKYIAEAIRVLSPTEYYEEINSNQLRRVSYLLHRVTNGVDFEAAASLTAEEMKAIR
jgi:hypothetical protein